MKLAKGRVQWRALILHVFNHQLYQLTALNVYLISLVVLHLRQNKMDKYTLHTVSNTSSLFR